MNEQAHAAVYEVLCKALSQNTNDIKPAEEKLQEWAKSPGFYSILVNIFNNGNIDVNIRLLAVLYCKNGINKYWRASASNALCSEEKEYIRKGLLENIADPIPLVAVQKAVLVSKIARFDWPDQWDGLVETLVSRMEGAGGRQAALALHHTIKGLSTKLLPPDRARFANLSTQLLPVMIHYWTAASSLTVHKFNTNVDEGKKQLEHAHLLLKMIEKLLPGTETPKKENDVDKFIESVIPHMRTMLEIRLRTGCGGLIEKYCTRIIRMLAIAQKYLAKSFAPHTREAIGLIAWYAFTPEGVQAAYPLLLGHSLNFIGTLIRCIKCDEKKSKFVKSVKDQEDKMNLNQILQSVFDESTICRITDALISHYFPLKQEDLDLWESDPETLVEQWKEEWEGNVRKCANRLLLKLLGSDLYETVYAVIKRLAESHPVPDPSDLAAVIEYDAVFTSVMIVCLSIQTMTEDFDSMKYLVEKALVDSEAKWHCGLPGALIIKRRAAILAQLASDLLSQGDYYRIINLLLVPSEDLVIRLTAADSLLKVVDDFTFSQELFEPHLDSIIVSLLDLLCSVSQVDTKMRLLRIVVITAEQVGPAIGPHLAAFERLLPVLWAEGEGEALLRATIVRLLVALIREGSRSIVIRPVLLEMCFGAIAAGTDMSSNDRVYLLDDCLQLWHALVCSVSLTSDDLTNRLLSLATNLHNVLDNNTEFLKCWLNIVHAYSLLLPEQFITSCGSKLVQTTSAQLHDLNEEGIEEIFKMYELFIRVNPALGISVLRPVLPQIIKCIIDEELRNNVMTFSIIARVLLFSTDVFYEMAKEVCVGPWTIDKVMDALITICCEISPDWWITSERRKLRAMGLSTLLTMNISVLYNKFCGILFAVAETLELITDEPENGPITDKLVLSVELEQWLGDDSDSEYAECNEHEARRRSLALTDPVHTVPLMNFFGSQLNTLKNMVGTAGWADLLDTVDAETLENVRHYVTL